MPLLHAAVDTSTSIICALHPGHAANFVLTAAVNADVHRTMATMKVLEGLKNVTKRVHAVSKRSSTGPADRRTAAIWDAPTAELARADAPLPVEELGTLEHVTSANDEPAERQDDRAPQTPAAARYPVLATAAQAQNMHEIPSDTRSAPGNAHSPSPGYLDTPCPAARRRGRPPLLQLLHNAHEGVSQWQTLAPAAAVDQHDINLESHVEVEVDLDAERRAEKLDAEAEHDKTEVNIEKGAKEEDPGTQERAESAKLDRHKTLVDVGPAIKIVPNLDTVATASFIVHDIVHELAQLPQPAGSAILTQHPLPEPESTDRFAQPSRATGHTWTFALVAGYFLLCLILSVYVPGSHQTTLEHTHPKLPDSSETPPGLPLFLPPAQQWNVMSARLGNVKLGWLSLHSSSEVVPEVAEHNLQQPSSLRPLEVAEAPDCTEVVLEDAEHQLLLVSPLPQRNETLAKLGDPPNSLPRLTALVNSSAWTVTLRAWTDGLPAVPAWVGRLPVWADTLPLPLPTWTELNAEAWTESIPALPGALADSKEALANVIPAWTDALHSPAEAFAVAAVAAMHLVKDPVRYAVDTYAAGFMLSIN